LEDNAQNAVRKPGRSHARELREKRMRYTRIYTDENGPYASLRMYEKEAPDMIWQLLIAAADSVETGKEYSRNLMGGGTDVLSGRDEGSI